VSLGIKVRVRLVDTNPDFLAHHVPLGFASWGFDYPNASTYFGPLLGSDSLDVINITAVGASGSQLQSWGYEATRVPSIDDRIDACLSLVGTLQTWCWARLDQFAMERLVALIPLSADVWDVGTSPRIVTFALCTNGLTPALDRMVLAQS
jgi:hypothetical protein